MTRSKPRASAVAIGLCILGLGSIAPAVAGGIAEQVRNGISAYSGKHFAAAEKRFAAALAHEPGSPTAALDLGTAQYREGKYRKALSSFRRAATDRLASQRMQELATYDQGKALAKIGDRAAAGNPAAAVGAYRKSVEAFQRALQVDPHLKSAAYNIEVVRRRIRRLEQKPPKRSPGRAPGTGGTGKRIGKNASSKNGRSKSRAKAGSGIASTANQSTRPGRSRNGAGAQGRKQGSARQATKPVDGKPKTSGGTTPPAAPPGSRGSTANGSRIGTTPKSLGAGTRSSSAASVAQRILNAESRHPRIMNLSGQQVTPHVAQNW